MRKKRHNKIKKEGCSVGRHCSKGGETFAVAYFAVVPRACGFGSFAFFRGRCRRVTDACGVPTAPSRNGGQRGDAVACRHPSRTCPRGKNSAEDDIIGDEDSLSRGTRHRRSLVFCNMGLSLPDLELSFELFRLCRLLHRSFKHGLDDGLGLDGKCDPHHPLPPRSRPRRRLGPAHHHRQRPLRARLLLFNSVGDVGGVKN